MNHVLYLVKNHKAHLFYRATTFVALEVAAKWIAGREPHCIQLWWGLKELSLLASIFLMFFMANS